MVDKDQIADLHGGGKALGSNGDRIGSIAAIYLDDRSGRPAWATVNTGLFGTAESFIPLQDAEVDGQDLRFPYSRDQVRDAPRMNAEEHLDAAGEQELYRYYGVSDDTADGARPPLPH